MEIHINGPRNKRKPWKKKEAHLLDNLGLKHRSKCSTMNPRSGGPKLSPNPSRAAGAGLGKIDAQYASGLRFEPSTYPRKANEKIYKLTKDMPKGAQPGHGCTPGAAAPVWLPNRPNFGLLAHADNSKAVAGCVGAIIA
jgi:hypothetical protein